MIFEALVAGYLGEFLKKGDEVVVLPSGFTTKIKSILQAEKEVDEAFYPQSVTILLEDEIDVSRGDMLVKPNNQPNISQDLDAESAGFQGVKN